MILVSVVIKARSTTLIKPTADFVLSAFHAIVDQVEEFSKKEFLKSFIPSSSARPSKKLSILPPLLA
jgi:hypothetical protein